MLNFTVIDYIVLGIFILERIYHIQRPWLNKKVIERTQPKMQGKDRGHITRIMSIQRSEAPETIS